MATVEEATTYLASFINRTLHIHIKDGHRDQNIILSMTHEYRAPSQAEIVKAAERHEAAGLPGNVKVDMRKRFIGLVVVPGEYITKIEAEN
ncbi:hypothetical protein LTR95_004731 [Oleoguttula sp. CCFEE 5521]